MIDLRQYKQGELKEVLDIGKMLMSIWIAPKGDADIFTPLSSPVQEFVRTPESYDSTQSDIFEYLICLRKSCRYASYLFMMKYKWL